MNSVIHHVVHATTDPALIVNFVLMGISRISLHLNAYYAQRRKAFTQMSTVIVCQYVVMAWSKVLKSVMMVTSSLVMAVVPFVYWSLGTMSLE